MTNDAGRGPETDPTTTRILDAARDCFAETGVRKTTMNAVADRAGVGVATVYRRFPQKPQLVRMVLFREATQLVDGVDAAIVGATTVEDQLLTGFVAFTREFQQRKLLHDVGDSDDIADALKALPGHGSPILGLGRMYLADLIRKWQANGQLSDDFDANMVAEIYARLAHSLGMIPDGVIPLNDPAKATAFARKYLLPLLRPIPEI
ncbi:TetR/AcrR family transcriptional regulator [Smaragdicoccus niigatensis]|uniref:TetR/AcrR family transcriptional regulator n=1 Tax=Smaragdicoccus niigatensis TaxID=359359 RepID=UPI00036408F3|nr:TetR/AcrR family transcriptional regulator [Smaragdicoccus niigatensis]